MPDASAFKRYGAPEPITDIDPDIIEERVREGFDLLLTYYSEIDLPDEWREVLRIAFERNTVQMQSPSRCILGVLFGDYHAGLRALDISIGAPWGFDGDDDDVYPDTYSEVSEALAQEWRKRVMQPTS
jgi:hypothetical protein